MKYSGTLPSGQDDFSNMSLVSQDTLERCENCDYWTPEENMALIEVYTPSKGLVTMNVCDHCATPVQLEVVPISEIFYIYYVDGFGANRKVIEASGITEEDALRNFAEKWADMFNRDLITFKSK